MAQPLRRAVTLITTPQLEQKMTSAYIAVSDVALKQNIYMRDAAYVVAIHRVAQACRDRGWA